MLGTLGRCVVQLSCWASSTGSALAAFRFDKRDSETGFFSALEAPTCLTELAGIVEEPLLGGIGGFDEDCRRWWARDVKGAIEDDAGRDGRLPLG